MKLGTESKIVHKTELDKIFDELPKVPGQGPRYVNHNSDATRAITAQLKDLKLEKGKAAPATIPAKAPNPPKPLNLPVNTPFRRPEDKNASKHVQPIPPFRGEQRSTKAAGPSVQKAASKPVSIPPFRGDQRFINGVPCGIEVPYKPSAPQMSPPKTTYSYIPSDYHRFENMRPMSDEYRRPPPFYEPHGNWNNFGWPPRSPPTPPPKESKSKCVIS